jgi:hypothetical protein
MSALGQKQTFAAQKVMSALPLIATVKADIAVQDAYSYVGNRRVRTMQELLLMPGSQNDSL